MDIIKYLNNNQTLALFIAIFIGFAISKIRIKGFTVGSAGVIIAGIILGNAGIIIPDIVRVLGLLMFIYAVGIQSGPKIFSIFTKNNIKYLGIAIMIFLFATLIAFSFSLLMGMPRDVFVGVYCGVFGSASALANIIGNSDTSPALLAYSLAYPVALFMTLIFVNIIIQRYHLDENPHLEGEFEKPAVIKDEKIITQPIIVTHHEAEGVELSTAEDKYGVKIKELMKEEEPILPDFKTVLHEGDILLVEGYESDINRFEKAIGEKIRKHFKHIPGVGTRQVLVTNRDLDGKSIKEIQPRQKYNCIITRIWRSGIFIPAPESRIRLELGDSLVIMGKQEDMDNFTRLAGRQDKSSGELDFLSMSFVVVLGLLLGDLPIPLPSGVMKLGVAGGTLLIALLVGYFRRIGFVYGQMTPQARVITRDLGLTFFMLGVGINAGTLFNKYSLSETFSFFLTSLSVVMGFLLSVFFLILFYRGRRRAATILSLFCGAVTNTPALGLVITKTRCEEFMIPYASVYPITQVLIIILSQLLYVVYYIN